MDFNNEEDLLVLVLKFIVEVFFGIFNLKRCRLLKEEFINFKRNGIDFLVERYECFFFKEVNIFFVDIVEFMDFFIKSKREVEKVLFLGIRGMEEFFGENKNDGNFFYNDIIFFYGDV